MIEGCICFLCISSQMCYSFLSFSEPSRKTLGHRGSRDPLPAALRRHRHMLCCTTLLGPQDHAVLCWPDSLPQGNLSWPVTMEEPRGGIYLVPIVTPWLILVFILRGSNILSFKHPVENPVKSLKTSVWVSLSPSGKCGQCAMPWS